MSVAPCVDDAHLLHEAVVGEIGPTCRDLGVVKREIGQLALAIPPGKFLDLSRADAAIAVVNDDIGCGAIIGCGKRRVVHNCAA